MPEVSPNVFLRIGSHSEKEYIEKLVKYFDGIIVGANLLEASEGATSSLLLKLHDESNCRYFIDPMTYAYGQYVDPDTQAVRSDLDWIKSDQKVRGGKKGEIVRNFKSSYKKLADKLGPPFSTALERNQALGPADFGNEQFLQNSCGSILNYQANRLRQVFESDPEMAEYVDDLPRPAALFAPYFYIEESRAEEWIELNRRLSLAAAASNDYGSPLHLIICSHRNVLTDKRLSAIVIQNIKDSHAAGVWLWFSQFDEHSAAPDELAALRSWVEQLSPVLSVYNMHGSFFSLALSKFGMSGIAHGVGYGEQKDVVPIIGQSTPTVQYYVRQLHAKYSVVQITRCFSTLGVKTPADFYKQICDCVMCQGIVKEDLSGFSQFGDIYKSRPDSKRLSQTPAAAKRCRFHFLLNRIKERQFVRNSPLGTIVADAKEASKTWSRSVVAPFAGHLRMWSDVLE